MGEIMKCYTAICLDINNKTFLSCVEPISDNCRPLMCGFNYEDKLCNLCSNNMCNLEGNETFELKKKEEEKEKQLLKNPKNNIEEDITKSKIPIVEKPKEKVSIETKNQTVINCLLFDPYMEKQKYIKCQGGVCYVQRCIDANNKYGYWHGCINGKTEFDCLSIGCAHENRREYIPKNCIKCSEDYCNGNKINLKNNILLIYLLEIFLLILFIFI